MISIYDLKERKLLRFCTSLLKYIAKLNNQHAVGITTPNYTVQEVIEVEVVQVCIASVSVGVGAKKNAIEGFSVFARAKNGARAKKRNPPPPSPSPSPSLLASPTETLAMQVIKVVTVVLQPS